MRHHRFHVLLIMNALFMGLNEGNSQDIQTVQIGSQVWMKENLDTDRFRNGDPIEQVRTDRGWNQASIGQAPATCTYLNTDKNGKQYGRLYNWYAVSDPRGLCPAGWRVPTDIDWRDLKAHLGGKKKAGGKIKSLTGWNQPNEKATNLSGFTALPGGSRDYFGEFDLEGSEAVWWSSTEHNHVLAWARLVHTNGGRLNKVSSAKGTGNSVRCIKE